MADSPKKHDPEDGPREESFDTGFGEEGTLEIPVPRGPASEGHQQPPAASDVPSSSGFGSGKTEVIPPMGIAPHARLFSEGTKSIPEPVSFREEQTEVMPVYARPHSAGVQSGPGSSEGKANVEPNRRSGALRSLLTVFLFTWASLATIAAVWLWAHRPEEVSPLENLPDDGTLQGQIVSPVEGLSSRQVVGVGESLQVGWLEVSPLWIESRPVRIAPENIATEPVLILHLRVRNLSPDQAFAPLDPAFLYPMNGKKLAGLPMFDNTGYTYTFLHRPERPDQLLLPFDLPHSLGQSIQGQEFPHLKPGESADVIIISGEDAYEQMGERMVWRIKLRKGRAVNGKGVATVIAVPFRKVDITSQSAEPAHES